MTVRFLIKFKGGDNIIMYGTGFINIITHGMDLFSGSKISSIGLLAVRFVVGPEHPMVARQSQLLRQDNSGVFLYGRNMSSSLLCNIYHLG